jgi:hypothetical protein
MTRRTMATVVPARLATLSCPTPGMEADMKQRFTLGVVLLALGGMALAQQTPTVSPVRPPARGEAPSPPIRPTVAEPGTGTPAAADPLVLPDDPPRPASRIPPTTIEAAPPARPHPKVDWPAPASPRIATAPAGVGYDGRLASPAIARPDDMTIDQLLEGIEALRAQREAMEKREKAMLKVLRQKAEKLNQRINSLDGEAFPPPQLAPQPVAPTVAR